MTVDRPTPPAPNTTTEEPGSTLAVFKTDPIPVVTAHPITAAISWGKEGGMTTHETAGTTTYSARQANPQ